MKKFEIGKTYSTRSACDYECIFSFKVVSRTEKMVSLEYHGKIIRRKVSLYEGEESCKPLGSYSMAPVIHA